MKVVLKSGGGAASFEEYIVRVPAGETVFSEGDVGTEMYVIQSGTVDIVKRVKDEARVLSVLERGDFFGEMSMLIQTERTAGAAAGPDGARLVAITRDNFDMILRENPGIVLAILREMATRLKNTSAALSAARGA